MSLAQPAVNRWRLLISGTFVVLTTCGALVLMGLLLTRDYDASNTDATPLPPRRQSTVFEHLQVTQIEFTADGTRYAAKQGVQVPQLVVRNTADDFPVAAVSDSIGFADFHFRPDGNAVIFTDLQARETLLSYDLNTDVVRVLVGGLRGLRTFAVAPHDNIVAVALAGRLVEVYDLATVRTVGSFAVNDGVLDLQFDASSQWLAIVMQSSVTLVDIRSGDVYEQDTFFDSNIGAVAFHPPSNSLYIGTTTGQIIVRDLDTRTESVSSIAFAGPVLSLSFNPRNDRLAVLVGRGLLGQGYADVWTLDGDTPAHLRRIALPDGAHGLTFRPDGKLVILPDGLADADPDFVPPMQLISIDD